MKFAWNKKKFTLIPILQGKMITNDRQEEARVDAKNALEEYVYDLRGKLCDDSQLSPFVTESDRKSLSEQLNDVVSWLYEDGEDCNRQIYADKLEQLRVNISEYICNLPVLIL